MPATAINHVSLAVDALEPAVDFYEEVLGLEQIPSVNSSARGAWFQLDNGQLHLTERAAPSPQYHHLALTVEDFAGLVATLEEREALDDTFGAPLYEFPDGAVQVYFRDPSDNLLEADWPDISTLPADLAERAQTREEVLGTIQTDDITLFPD
ncbi:MAG: VOC family protein [Salinirussus sp.]